MITCKRQKLRFIAPVLPNKLRAIMKIGMYLSNEVDKGTRLGKTVQDFVERRDRANKKRRKWG